MRFFFSFETGSDLISFYLSGNVKVCLNAHVRARTLTHTHTHTHTYICGTACLIEVKHFFLSKSNAMWHLNLCRVVVVFNESKQYTCIRIKIGLPLGFLYTFVTSSWALLHVYIKSNSNFMCLPK